MKVLKTEFSIVENLSGLQENIFNLSRSPQLHFGEKTKKMSNCIKFTDFPPFPLFGVPWAAVMAGWRHKVAAYQAILRVTSNDEQNQIPACEAYVAHVATCLAQRVTTYRTH